MKEKISVSKCTNNIRVEKYFSIVRASTLSLSDEFLEHEPENDEQREFKLRLIQTIKSGMSDFRAQRIDATIDEFDKICYQKGKKPAVGKSPIWWEKNAKEVLPEKESRLGTINERTAFLALLIKYLTTEQGYTISDAWKIVCNQSKDLGHYKDTKNAKNKFETTGSRGIGEWYDLANTCKIIIDDTKFRFFSNGGFYYDNGDEYPLASFNSIVSPCFDLFDSVGWIVCIL